MCAVLGEPRFEQIGIFLFNSSCFLCLRSDLKCTNQTLFKIYVFSVFSECPESHFSDPSFGNYSGKDAPRIHVTLVTFLSSPSGKISEMARHLIECRSEMVIRNSVLTQHVQGPGVQSSLTVNGDLKTAVEIHRKPYTHLLKLFVEKILFEICVNPL